MTQSVVYSGHIDACTPKAQIRKALSESIDVNFCALCDGEFNQSYIAEESPVLGAKRPWARAFNIMNPAVKKVENVEELSVRGNIVHVVCNCAQNNTPFDDFIEICKFFATRIDIGRFQNHRSGNYDFSEPSVVLSSKLISGLLRNNRHCLSREDVQQIVASSLCTYEFFTGLKIGYGADVDLNLDDYHNWPSLLRLSIDRIDTSIADGPNAPRSNYRVTLRTLNYAKGSFGDEVVFRFIENLLKKYRCNSQ